uniref:Uncharacterized protein n=1 Tax=Anguilla anguilla TaxID=7936 RepID=A0A0E9PT17_ANGAN
MRPNKVVSVKPVITIFVSNMSGCFSQTLEYENKL